MASFALDLIPSNPSFTYKSLNHEAREIRLLLVQTARPDEPLQCSLLYASLDEAPDYRALSYIWGDKNQRTSIKVDEKSFEITCNLERALRTLRNVGRTDLPVWVDAICINQDDLRERGHQVGLMRNIYGSAALVIAWVGSLEPSMQKDTDACDSAALNCITNLTAISETIWDQPYWRRVWILQELFAAKKIILHFDDYYIEWVDSEAYWGVFRYDNRIYSSIASLIEDTAEPKRYRSIGLYPQENDPKFLEFPPVYRIVPAHGPRLALGRYLDDSYSFGCPATILSSAVICFPSRTVSVRQCEIWPEGDHWWIQDVNSSGGTYVNGHRLLPGVPRSLANDDVVRLSGPFRDGKEPMWLGVKFRVETDRVPGPFYVPKISSRGSDAVREISRLRELRDSKRSLFDLVERFHGALATDFRDKIFALLGISTDGEARFAPDYTLSNRNLCIAMTEAIYLDSRLDFLIRRSRGNDNSLPTWVPNWTSLMSDPDGLFYDTMQDIQRMRMHRTGFCSHQITPKTKDSLDDRLKLFTGTDTLTVDSVYVCDITATSSALGTNTRPLGSYNASRKRSLLQGGFSWLIPQSKRKPDAVAKMMALNQVFGHRFINPELYEKFAPAPLFPRLETLQIVDVDSPPARAMDALYAQIPEGVSEAKRTALWMHQNRHFKIWGESLLDLLGIACADTEIRTPYLAMRRGLETPEKYNSSNERHYIKGFSRRLASGYGLFISENGYIGWAHPMAKPGDQIFFIDRCKHLVILRQVDGKNGYYNVIGAAHLVNKIGEEPYEWMVAASELDMTEINLV